MTQQERRQAATQPRKMMKIGLVGALVTALCCFTPLLVVIFGALGLGGLLGYVDLVLLPALLLFTLLILVAFFQMTSGGRK